METYSLDELNQVKTRVNNGTADIYDVLTGIHSKIIDFPELHRPNDAKIFFPFRSPILDTGDESDKTIVFSTFNDIIGTLMDQYEEGNLNNLDGHLQFIDVYDRHITKQESLRHYNLALKYLEDDCEFKSHSTPFDVNRISLQEEKEMINLTVVMNLMLDNFCEIIDRLKTSNSIDNIDTTKLNPLFNNFVDIKINRNNIDNIGIINEIRNCIRHNDYSINTNYTIDIKTDYLELNIKNPFFDGFNQSFIEDIEDDVIPIQENAFLGVNREEGFENNKNTVINYINQIYQTNITQEQITMMEDFFNNFKFRKSSLKFCISTIGLDSIKEKYYFRRIMIDAFSYLMDVKNYDLNTFETTVVHNKKIPRHIIDNLIKYIKVQCIKYYYINNSDLDRSNNEERHLRNCFTHGRYTDSFWSNKIAVCDRNIHRIDSATGNPVITYQNTYNIDDLYNMIEAEGGFSNISDIRGDNNLKGFIVGNFIEDKAGKLKTNYRYLIYDSEKGKYKEISFGGKITTESNKKDCPT